jgi:signal transduction histidine kinase
MAALSEVETRKLALAEAIDRTMARMRVATWRSDADAPLDVAMLVSAAWFDQHVGSRVLSSARSDSVEVRIVGADGAELVAAAATDRGSDANAGAAPARTFERTVEIDGLALRLEARPRDVAALAAERSRRQTFYLSLLGLVALVMASGAWFTVRAVRHELAVAQLKADFVAAVSHEFRSPLTGIRQLGELLMRGRVPSGERRQEYYTRITRESDRLSRMVEHLLDFARMESGRREYRLALSILAPCEENHRIQICHDHGACTALGEFRISRHVAVSRRPGAGATAVRSRCTYAAASVPFHTSLPSPRRPRIERLGEERVLSVHAGRPVTET